MTTNVRMLKEGQEADVQVSWEDQQNINLFSKLNTKYDRIEDQLSQLKTQMEATEEAYTEVENLVLMEECDAVPIRVGDAFFVMNGEEAQEKLEQMKDEIRVEHERLDKQLLEVSGEMGKLKTALYARFGNSINLDRD
jgi:prefoldin subunit 4